MKFTSFTTVVATLLYACTAPLSVSASPVAAPAPVVGLNELQQRDVYVPPITYPTAGVVWTVGETRTVTWDTSDPPVNITNKLGRVQLRKGDFTGPLILADKFDILLGQIDIVVPWVENGDDYRIVLFGDSGNWSPQFTIRNAY